MWIRFRTSISGTNFSHKPGDVVLWPDEAEAKRFVAAEYAEECDPPRRASARVEVADARTAGETTHVATQTRPREAEALDDSEGSGQGDGEGDDKGKGKGKGKGR